MSKHGSYSIASRKNNCGNFFFVFYGERGSVLALLHSYSKYGSFKIEIKTVITCMIENSCIAKTIAPDDLDYAVPDGMMQTFI